MINYSLNLVRQTSFSPVLTNFAVAIFVLSSSTNIISLRAKNVNNEMLFFFFEECFCFIEMQQYDLHKKMIPYSRVRLHA